MQILEAELQAQAIVLETLNTSLYHCQLELQREVRPGWREKAGPAAEEAQSAVLCRPGALPPPRGVWGRRLFKFIFQKTVVGNLEKLFQTKLAEAEEKYKYTIQILTEENICLRYGLRGTVLPLRGLG